MDNTLYYLEIIINFLEKNGDIKTEMYLDSQDLESYKQIETIIINAMNGKDEENGLYRLNDVRRFLTNIQEYYYKNQNPIVNYISSVLLDLEPNTFIKKYNYITNEEMEGIEKIGEKRRLPVEMQNEIASFVGYKTGGRKKKTKTKRRKNKKIKTKTKRIKNKIKNKK